MKDNTVLNFNDISRRSKKIRFHRTSIVQEIKGKEPRAHSLETLEKAFVSPIVAQGKARSKKNYIRM